MRLVCVGSSSKGNGYALIAENEILLLEAGCRLIDVKKAIEWQISKVVGGLVSHAHLDHSAYIKEFMESGIPIYGGEGTQTDIEERGGERIKSLPLKAKTRIGEFIVQPFELEHDCPCCGFLITHPEMGKLVFATDTEYVKYRFSNVNHIMIEANYSKEYLDDSKENAEKRKHVLYGHMSIETASDFVIAHDSYDLQNVVLMHLSEHNGSPSEFKDKVSNLIDCRVEIAAPGLEIDLRKIPF